MRNKVTQKKPEIGSVVIETIEEAKKEIENEKAKKRKEVRK